MEKLLIVSPAILTISITSVMAAIFVMPAHEAGQPSALATEAAASQKVLSGPSVG